MYILIFESIILRFNPFSTMRIFVALISICASICFFTSSCSKTETKTVTETDTVVKTVTDTLRPPVTIVGFWVGTYQVTGSPTTYYYSLDLRPDGTLLHKGTGADGNTYYGQGTYTVNGANFSYSDTTLNLSQTGAVEIGTGTYTATAGTITGNWQNLGSTVTGTLSVTKSE
jgi:hypothetical protein